MQGIGLSALEEVVMFISKKKQKVEKLVFEYLDLAGRCLDCCEENFELFSTNNVADEEFFKQLSRVHGYESRGDDKRREIEYLMYEESLIPESRGDVLGLLETVDQVPNAAETMLHEIYKMNCSVPEGFRSGFKELFSINIEASKLAVKITVRYFEKPERIVELQAKIDELESQSDRMQTRLVRDIFMSDLDNFQKLILKELIHIIGNMSDVSETVADRVKILSVKTVF